MGRSGRMWWVSTHKGFGLSCSIPWAWKRALLPVPLEGRTQHRLEGEHLWEPFVRKSVARLAYYLLSLLHDAVEGCNRPFNLLQLQGKAPLSVVPRVSEQANKNRQGWLNCRPAEVSLTQLLMFGSASACLPSREFSLWQRRVLPPVTQLAWMKQRGSTQRRSSWWPRQGR